MSPRMCLKAAALGRAGTRPQWQADIFWPPGQSRPTVWWAEYKCYGFWYCFSNKLKSPRNGGAKEWGSKWGLSKSKGRFNPGPDRPITNSETWAAPPHAAYSCIILLAPFKKQYFWSPVISRRFLSHQEQIFMYLENSHLVTKCSEIAVDSLCLSSKRPESILTYILLNFKTPPQSKGKEGNRHTWHSEHSRLAQSAKGKNQMQCLWLLVRATLNPVLSVRNSVHNVVFSN